MACRYREELVGKRFISVRSPQKLKIQKISEWEWRSGVVRAVSNRDTTSLDLSVLIEFDDIDWTRREWVRVHDIFQLFLVEHTLVWAERPDPDKPRISLSWPGLSFRAVVDKAGLAVCKRKPVEFLVDRFLGLVEEKEIQIFQEGDESTHSTATLRPAVQSSLKEWLDYQDGQKILLTTPTVLVGYRLEVYRAEGTTQWYTAVIQSYNHTSKTLSVTDDTVLEEHNEDPTIIQMHLIDEGVVDSILRGVEIGGIAPRRRPRQVKENNPQSSTNRTSANANTTPNSSRGAAQAKKPRTPQQQSPSHVSPATSVPSVPSPSSLTNDKPDSKVAEKTVRPSARKKQKLDENSTKSKQPPSKVEVETSQPLSVETTTQVRVSPRNTPCKERSRPQRSRERDKNVLSTCLTSKSDTKSVSDKNTSESVNTTKARSCSKKDEKVSAQINQTGIESPKQENTSPRRRSQSRTPVHNNIESVIKTNLSGSKKNKREVEDTKKVINQSAKKETSEETPCDVNVGRENSEKPKACLSTKSISGISGCQTKVEQTAACTETVVEQKVQEIKSALKKREKESGINKTEVKEKKTRSVKNSGDKEVKKRERKKDNVVKDPTCASRTTLHKENCVRSTCKDSTNASGDNMHYIKKKQSLLTGASETPNNNIPVPSSNIDVNRSVTDQVSRAEKLTSVNGEVNRFGSVSSTLSSPISERDVELTGSRDHRQVHVSGHSFNAASSSGSFTQDEHTFSRSSDSRCSSGLSGDEARRPGSRIDEIKSVKNSPASSPLIVDKSEPLQIYRDPELMSKNPVRSNVPIMHNSHKSYPNVHNPIPTPASRPSSVGMTSASLSNSLDRSSRAPVIPSVGFMGLSSAAAASLPGVSLSSLLPHGLHQLDPATLALHQQFAAVQQHQQLAAAALQQYNSLALSYPPHAGGLTKAQVEHLWRQKYPHMQVPPPWPLTQHDDLVGEVRLMQEQEQQRAERDRMERLERERDLREREQRERKERERRERERMEKERLDRERREREKIEQERAEREREREKQEKERLEREKLEREKNRILKETTVDSQAAVEQHFTKSLQQASQRNWKSSIPNHHHTAMQDGYSYQNANNSYRPKYTAAQTGMWPQPSITLGTGKQKHDHQAMTGHPNKMGEIKPEEKIKQELQMETDTKIAEMMRKQQDEERILQKHQELMHKQGMYLQRSAVLSGVDKKPDIKQENGGRDVKPVLYPTNVGSVKQERGDVGSASFSLYGYQPEKYSYISADQLQSYELDKKVMMDSKMSRPQSPKKGLSVPPPLIKDTKTTHNSVIVENKGGSGMQGLKSSSPHAGHYPGSHMSPHPQPKPAHTTPERSIDRPHSSNSSPGSHHGISPSMAHQHGVINMSRSGTSRSQSPLRIASPQQLSAAVMQPMDYRCSPNVSKNRGSPGSNLSPRPSSASSNHSPAFSPSIAQPPTSLPHSAVNFTYGLITQGLVPNPIYSTNNSKSSDSQRTVSVTGTAQVPCGPQSPSTYNQTQQPSAPGAKRKGQKEGTTRKRQKGNDSHSQMAGNPQNFSVPNTTPQIMTNSSPYTTSSANIPSAAMSISQTSMSPAASLSQAIVNNRLSGFTGFMDSFKSFVENTVQSAFMSDQEQVKAKDAQLKRPTPEQVQEMQLLQAQKSQPYKPKMSLERSCTPVASGQPTPSNPPPDEASNISNSSSNPNMNQGFVDSINRVANGQIDTDSDTLSAPSPPPHLKQDNNNMQSHHHKTAKHPNLKKAWLQRHSEDDRNGSSKPPMFPAPSQSPSITPDGLGSNSGTEDKESVKNCFVNCSYISPRKEGGAKSPISAIQVAVLPNGPTEGKETPALTNDESTTSASEAENPGAENSANPRKRAKNKKETVRNLKKPKTEPRPEDQESNNSSSSNNATTTTTTTTTKKVNRRSKESNKKGPDNMSEEQIKKIVETCKESVKDKEKGSKPTEEAFDKKYEFDDISEQKSDTTGDNDPNLSEDPQESESGKKNDKKEKKKIKEKKEKKPKKEKQQKEKKGDKVDEDSDASENVYIPPQPILKETELKAQQTTFSKPLVKQSDADLRKSCEPFLQDGSCSEVTPKLMKCRECKMTPTQRGKTVPNIFCRFYAFRRLKYSHRGFVTIDSFSELSDADQEDIDPWIPKFPIIEPKIDVETARFIIRRVGDKFCDLLQQEKDALMCTGENSKLAWKRAVTGVREMCDVCDTTLFNMHWVCHKCGFVVCLDCYKVKAQDGDNSESETDEESQEGSEGEEEKRKWLTCSANKQPHRVDKLMLTQIIPSDALWEVGRMMHETRERWKIQPSCPCSPKINTKKNGIKSELVNEAMKHASPKKKLMNGVNTDEDQVKKNGNLKSAVYNVENASPLDLLANVASMDSEKSRDSTESPLNSKKKEAKNGKSYNPITEPVSPGSSEKKMPSSCSTLRELLTKTAGGKVKNNSDSNKKKNKHNNPLKDIIQTVVDKNVPKDMETNDNSVVKSEVEQPMKLMHYTPRLGSSHILVRATPIIAHNLTETSVIYPDVPHSWLCDGRLLRLHEPRHKGNLQIFMEQWKRGQPVIVSNVHKYINQDLWKPSYFSKHFGEIKNDLINCRTGCVVVDHPMRHFWDGFSCIEERLVDEDGVPMLLKLKDWPPGDDFSDVLPTQFQDLMQALPLPEYTRRDGRLNLVSRLPDFLVKPDLGPKMYIAYGSAKFPKEGTTNLHLDVSDATNVMVHVGYLDEEERGFVEKDQDTIKAMEMARCDQITKRRIREIRETPGALWHIFDAVDADKIRDFLNKVAKERGEVIEQHHDPIHDQSWYLDEELRERLAKEYGVLGYTILQCLGDAVFIPAGAPHQVRNLNNCIKVAEDFVSPENIHHCFQLTQEFRDLSYGHSNHEDKLQIKNIVYHAVKDSTAVLHNADPDDYEDGD